MEDKTRDKIREARRILFGADIDLMEQIKGVPTEKWGQFGLLQRERGEVLAAISVLDGMAL